MKKPLSIILFACLVLISSVSAFAQNTEIYRVGVGDVLDVRLLNSAGTNSTLFTVVANGVIELPIAGGAIKVAGLTTEEIQTRIAAELKRRAVEENAKVSVGVRQYVSHAVTVTGLVVHPGTRFLRREEVPLYVVLAESQLRNDGQRVAIMRGDGPAQILDLRDPTTLNTHIHSGDVITVSHRDNVQAVYRSILAEGNSQPLDWLTVDAENLTVNVVGLPGPSDISLPVDVNMVVEFMSR